jgi:hypothetical protein
VRFKIPYHNLMPITKFTVYTLDKDGKNYLTSFLNDSKEDSIYYSVVLKG